MIFQDQPKLREFKIEVTHRCPLACVHCSSDSTPSCQREMSRQGCLDILQEAIEMGVEEVAFSGGEPLIWPFIEEAVEIAAIGNLKVTLYTSGNADNVGLRLRGLKKRGLNRAIFSLFGHKAQLHEYITRVAGSFNATIEAISSAQKADLETEFHFVALAKNYQSLSDVAEFGRQLNVSKISVLRFVPQGRGYLLAGSILNKVQNLELKRTIERLRSEGYDIRTGSPFNFLMLNDQPACFSAINRVIIGPDLRLYPCDAFKQIKAEEIVGTLRLSSLEGATLKECWQGSPFFQAVRNYLQADFNEPCKSCTGLKKCLSGCLAQKVIAYGGLEKKPDPMCLLF